jgi:hypothetical protein
MEETMSNWRSPICLALLAGLAPVCTGTASAETTPEREAMRRALARVERMYERWPARVQNRAAGGIRHMANLSRNWDSVSKAMSRLPGGRGFPAFDASEGVPLPEVGHEMTAAGVVSDPGTDLNYGGLTGFVQSETSTAWCSPNVVVGFNDSGSQMESNFFSFNGVARSTNNGTRFTDLGYLPVTNSTYFLSGDPVLRCTDSNTFYYASLLLDFGTFTSAISVSKSTNGGITFDNPVKAASKSLLGHFLDKEWLAVDPSNPQNLYVTYTDFDSTGSTCGSTSTTSGNFPIVETRIDFVKSTDGGRTWSAPQELATACDPAGHQGSQVVVDALGQVYVSYTHFGGGPTGRQIIVRKSTDGGSIFSAPVTVADVSPGGLFGVLQGNVRTNEFATLAVDNSSGPRAGHVYIAWTDGSLAYVPEAFGTYRFTDILFKRSTDGGSTWSSAVRVNNNVDPIPAGTDPFLAGRGTDQFFPGMAVDRAGALAMCWYDRRRDLNNFVIDRECGKSTNGGATWSNVLKGGPFLATHSQDGFVESTYMGDYDDVASDFSEVLVGFRGAYGNNARGNPDVRFHTP